MLSRKIFLILAILILMNSMPVFAGVGTGGGDISCIDPVLSDEEFKVDFERRYATDPASLCEDTMKRAVELGFDVDLGKFNIGEVQKLAERVGQDWSDYVSFEGVLINKDWSLNFGKLIDINGNILSDPENLKIENGKIIADSFKFKANKDSKLEVINSADNTKINLNIPAGGSVNIINKEGIFETTTSPGVTEEIVSKCPNPLVYTAEQDSTLTIQKNTNSIYKFSNGRLEFEINNKKQLLRSKTSPSQVELDPCSGFICLTLSPEAQFDYENNLNSFYLENPETGQDYTFCLEKSQGDGYKIQNAFILNKVIKFFNYKKDKVYLGIDQNNEASLTIQKGLITEFKLKNKNPSQKTIARLWPTKSFEIREEQQHSYLTLLNQLPDYTTIESYTPNLNSESPSFWMKNNILYQDNKEGKLGRALPPNNQEFAKLIAKLSFKKTKINEILKQWK